MMNSESVSNSSLTPSTSFVGILHMQQSGTNADSQTMKLTTRQSSTPTTPSVVSRGSPLRSTGAPLTPLMATGVSPKRRRNSIEFQSNENLSSKTDETEAASFSQRSGAPASSHQGVDVTKLPGAAAPYATDTEYRTPPPRTSTERSLVAAASSRNMQQFSALVRNIISSSQEVIHAGVLDILVEHNDLESAKQLLGYSKLKFTYCGPVGLAAKMGNLDMIQVLIKDRRLEPNTGCPVRHAVLQNNMKVLEFLLNSDRINPNRGFPLYYAVMNENVDAVRLLLTHPRTFVNKMTPGFGTNPLGAAILVGNEEIYCSLLTHPRVDVNRGFTMTPLQMCAHKGRTHFARMLLSRPTVAVNKTLGIEQTPLELAVEHDQSDMVALLLKEPRIHVPMRLISKLEETNNIAMMQQLADATSLQVGPLWNKRMLLVPVFIILLLLTALLDIRFIMLAASVNISASILTLVVRGFSGFLVFGMLMKRSVDGPVYRALAVVPFAPLYELALGVLFFRNLFADKPDLLVRERTYIPLKIVAVWKLAFVVIPTLVIQGVALIKAIAEGGESFSVLNTGIVSFMLNWCLVACCWFFRKDHLAPSNRSSYVSLEMV